MQEILDSKTFQLAKLVIGIVCVIFGLQMLLKPAPADASARVKLETVGITATGTVTQAGLSNMQLTKAARPKVLRAAPLLRGLGVSRGVAHAVNLGLNARAARKWSKSGMDGDHALYDIEYEFPTKKGAKVPGKAEIIIDASETLKAGAPIEVLYDPLNPEIHRLTDFSDPYKNPASSLKLALAALGVMLGGLLIWWGWPLSGEATAFAATTPSSPLPAAKVARAAAAPRQSSVSTPRRDGNIRSTRGPNGFGQRA